MAGKGDSPRPVDQEKFNRNYDRIFGPCGHCGGAGVVDSGGQNPDGSWINVPCPMCQAKEKQDG